MSSSRRVLAVVVVATASIAVGALMAVPRGAASRSAQGTEPTPAYHSQVPPGALPQTLDPASFNNPLVQNAYAVAAKVKRVLYQQPCFCHCDRSIGHESLLDCYVGKHAAVCDVCMKEAFYAYEQTLKKKTPAQIREGILHGDWQQVDVSKYQTAPRSKP